MQVGHYVAHVEVRGRNSNKFREAQEYVADGMTFVEGREGSNFRIKFQNLSSKRVLIVPSVDGLSVMDGKPIRFDSRGYVVPAYGTVDIDGWRLNDNEVSEFVFKDRKDSYSEATGQGDTNAGAIGLMVYEEKEATKPLINVIEKHHHHWPRQWTDPCPRPWTPYWYGYDLNPVMTFGSGDVDINLAPQGRGSVDITCSVASASATTETYSTNNTRQMLLENEKSEGPFALGTGFGNAAESRVQNIEFERKTSQPQVQIALYYDSRRNLKKRGIEMGKPTKGRRPDHKPQAFPSTGGCTPPAGWARTGN